MKASPPWTTMAPLCTASRIGGSRRRAEKARRSRLTTVTSAKIARRQRDATRAVQIEESCRQIAREVTLLVDAVREQHQTERPVRRGQPRCPRASACLVGSESGRFDPLTHLFPHVLIQDSLPDAPRYASGTAAGSGGGARRAALASCRVARRHRLHTKATAQADATGSGRGGTAPAEASDTERNSSHSGRTETRHGAGSEKNTGIAASEGECGLAGRPPARSANTRAAPNHAPDQHPTDTLRNTR